MTEFERYYEIYGDDYDSYPAELQAQIPRTFNTSPVPTGIATIQPAASTGAVASDPAAFTPWIDAGGGFMAPNFTANDWAWRDASDPIYTGDGSTQIGGGDAAGWFLTDEAKQRLGGWGAEDWANVSWQGGNSPHGVSVDRNDPRYWVGGAPPNAASGDAGVGMFDEASYNADVAAMAANNPLLAGNFVGKIKTGEKEGTTINWNGLNATPGATTSYWDTNPGEMNKALAAGLALVAGGGLLGNYMLTGNVAGAGAGGAAGAAGGAEAGSGALAGLGGVEPISYSGFTAAQGGIGSYGAGFGLPGGVVAGEAGGGILGLSNMAGIGTGASAGMDAVNAYNALNGTNPYVPEGGHAPGEAPGAYTNAGSPNYLGDVGDWILRNPQLAAAGIGAIGSALEGGGDAPGAGGAGGGAGGGWDGPISQMQAVQTRYAPPPGYRPGFSPEHVYIDTAYVPGAPQSPVVSGTTGGISGLAPGPDIPPMVPRFADGGYVGPASIDPESAFTRPSPWGMPAGIQALLQRPNSYSRFAGAAGGPQYSAPQTTGIQAMFDRLNTPTSAPARLTTRDNSRATELANWSQTGHNPTRMNNRVAATRAAPRVFNGGTRAGFGGYGIQQYADGGYIQGPGTETSDSIPAVIDGAEPAALSKNEFVLPAWLVRKIGNGSPEAGAQRLYAMMEQAKLSTQINPDALLSQLA